MPRQRGFFSTNQKIVIILLIGILCYIIFSTTTHQYKIDAVIKTADPIAVWEYVADFRYKPYIGNFKITSDESSHNMWKYEVRYKERFSHLLLSEGMVRANITAQILEPEHKYVIHSKFDTCFMWDVFCLNSSSTFEVYTVRGETFCIETTVYECPMWFKGTCRESMESQKNAGMERIINNFAAN